MYDAQKIGTDMMNARSHLDWTQRVVAQGLSALKARCSTGGKLSADQLDLHQQATYDLALSAAEMGCAEAYLASTAGASPLTETMASTFAAQMIQSTLNRLSSAPQELGLDRRAITPSEDLHSFLEHALSAAHLGEIGAALSQSNPQDNRGLPEAQQLMADTFSQFADTVVAPLAESIHREDQIIPDAILEGLKALGCFGLSVPEQYGGLLPDDREDTLGMIVVTEELSRVSLGGAGSLITRPEILSRALIEGGTEDQKAHWLPGIAAGDTLCAVAITEPDYGSDVASTRLKATMTEDGWLLDGAKTWSTFAGKANVLLTLARTNPDLSLGHKGLSLFLVEKPSTDEESFTVEQSGGGKLTGQSISTVGYRGMHSYQLFFDQFLVPHSHVIGESQGLGRGFYFTMRGFTGGRIQTAARACGLMQGAFEHAVRYSRDRKVFGKAIGDYQLSQVKIAKMAMAIAGGQQFTYQVGRLMDEGRGQMEASLVKLITCKSAEWVTREAMQLHGGMGYAEETAVSRYWLDARVLSIFEGTEETLALKVVGRALIEQAA
ncbi:MAG: acyl-CoA dehydrogenase family protein [Pseudomonadales bacterium]